MGEPQRGDRYPRVRVGFNLACNQIIRMLIRAVNAFQEGFYF